MKFLTLKQFIAEEVSSTSHIQMYFSPQGHRVTNIIRGEKTPVSEGKAYKSGEAEDTLGDDLHKVLGRFTPSSWDHETVAREFHHHLRQHGYYMATGTHPLVMSPADQAFKSGLKRKIAEVHNPGSPIPRHEMPHHDGEPGRTSDNPSLRMGRFTSVWSSQEHLPKEKRNPEGVSTKLFSTDANNVKKAAAEVGSPAERDSKVAIFNDEKMMHAAGPETNRWFIRAGEIQKIPEHGNVNTPTAKPGVFKSYNMNNDDSFNEYIKDKKHNVPKHHRDLDDYSKRPDANPRVLNYVKSQHPNFYSQLQSGTLMKKTKGVPNFVR